MPCMTLGESLTGVSYAQQAMATHAVLGVCMSLTEACVLALLVQGDCRH